MSRARIVAYLACSLDGYIADAEGGVAWLDPYASAGSGFSEFARTVGVLAMGRTTYDHSRRLGPPPMGDMRGVVLTHRPLPDDAPSSFVAMEGNAHDVAASLREMAAPIGKDVWLMGGGRVLADFLDAGEVDVLDLFVMPVLLGRGLPLFPERSGARVSLSLRSSETLASGVVQLVYEK